MSFLKLKRTTAFRKGKKKEEKKKKEEEALNKRLLNSSSAIFVTICSIIFYATNSFSRPGMSFLLENGFSLLRESQDPWLVTDLDFLLFLFQSHFQEFHSFYFSFLILDSLFLPGVLVKLNGWGKEIKKPQ